MNQTKLWKHFAAFLYDIFPILGIFLLTSFVVILARNGIAVEPHTLWFDFLLLAELSFYYVYSWKIGGQTLGMRAWKMKIIPNNDKQNTLTWKQSFARLFVGTLSSILFGAGLFWKISSKNNLSWMDLSSDSSVRNIE